MVFSYGFDVLERIVKEIVLFGDKLKYIDGAGVERFFKNSLVFILYVLVQ